MNHTMFDGMPIEQDLACRIALHIAKFEVIKGVSRDGWSVVLINEDRWGTGKVTVNFQIADVTHGCREPHELAYYAF